MKEKIYKLKADTQNMIWEKRELGLFGGADVVICRRPINSENSSKIFVVSRYAREISSVIFSLKEIFDGKIDYINKYYFYPKLAKSARRYIDEYGDDLGSINAMLIAAEAIADECESSGHLGANQGY